MANVPAQWASTNPGTFSTTGAGVNQVADDGAYVNSVLLNDNGVLDTTTYEEYAYSDPTGSGASNYVGARIEFSSPTVVSNVYATLFVLNTPQSLSAKYPDPQNNAIIYVKSSPTGAFTSAYRESNATQLDYETGTGNWHLLTYTPPAPITVSGLMVILRSSAGQKNAIGVGIPGSTRMRVGSFQYSAPTTCAYTLTATPATADCVPLVQLAIAETVTGGGFCSLDTSYTIARQTDGAGGFVVLSSMVPAAPLVGGASIFADAAVAFGHSYQYQVIGTQTGTMTTSPVVAVACASHTPGGCNDWTAAPLCTGTTWTAGATCAGTAWAPGG